MEALFLAWMIRAAVGREALRFEAVHEQEGDLSCGLAAAASLADLYWGLPCREADLRSALAPEDGRVERATDLGELAALLSARGFAVRAVRLDAVSAAEALRRGYVPLLVHLRDDGGHFALLLALERDVAVLADPARGLFTLDAGEFAASFSGGALAVVFPGVRVDRDRLDARTAGALGARRFLAGLAAGAFR